VRHDCADVDMVALGPRMLARLNFKGTLHTLQQPLKAPIFSTGIAQTKLSPQARMGSASGDSGDPPPALVLCGPSGAGKSTLMKLLTSEFREQFGFSVSHTTRSPRPGEQQGQDYHFTARCDMEALIEEGAFLEHAVFGGNMYGTSRASVAKVANQRKICILDIDMQGVKQIKQSGLKARYVFIEAPSMEVLEMRLRERGTENEASLKRRLDAARGELDYGRTEGNFDLRLVNDQVEKAYTQLREFIRPTIAKLDGEGGSGEKFI